jgi:hypothetical protein
MAILNRELQSAFFHFNHSVASHGMAICLGIKGFHSVQENIYGNSSPTQLPHTLHFSLLHYSIRIAIILFGTSSFGKQLQGAYFLPALTAALVTFPAPLSDLATDLMTPTATV